MTAGARRRTALDGELTIVTAAEQNQRLLAALRGGGTTLEVDLSGVTDLDTAGLQVLMLARREARRLDLTLEFRDASRAVTDVLAVAQLDEALTGTSPGAPAHGAGRRGTEPEA